MTKRNTKLPLIVLAISAFCIGMTEFISVGLLPDIARSFNVSIEVASLAVSGYAIGVALSAPIFTILTNKMGRKKLLILLMIIFVLGNLTVTISNDFYVFMIARIVTSFTHGVFFSIAGVIASELVSENKKASAISTVFSGLTLATITGVPIGTYIGNEFSWRVSFVIITVLGIISLVSIISVLPKNIKIVKSEMSLKQIKIIKNKKISLIYVATILGYGGTFVMYTYVSSILENVMGIKSEYVSLVLFMYGITLAIGNYFGGKFADKNTLKSLKIIFLLQALLLILFMIFMPNKIIGIITLLILGLFAFTSVPGLQHYVIKVSSKEYPESSNFASSLSISSFNIGIFLASIVGSQVVRYFSFRSTALFGAIFVGLAFMTITYLINMDKKD